MDDYMFDTVVAQSRAVYEPSTSYLEIYSYSVSLSMECWEEAS